MPYNNVITSGDIPIPEEISDELMTQVTEESAVMRLGRRLSNISHNQKRMPVMSAMATAYFVNGETGLKQTTEVNWTDKFIDTEELAVVVPVSNRALDDAEYDIWGEAKKSVAEAFGLAIDQAVLYGTNIPATWTTNLGAAGMVAGVTNANHLISAASYPDLYEAILGETTAGVAGLFGLVENDGYMVTGSISPLAMKRKLRSVRDTTGGPIFSTNMQQAGAYLLDGAPIMFPLNGAVSETYWLIAGMWRHLVYSMRQDMTYTLATEGVIQGANGAILYNLFQQDMIALRAVMRLGFALPHPLTRLDSGVGYPFAVLTA